MSFPITQLGKQDSWNPIVNESYEAVPYGDNSGHFLPIPKKEIGIIIESRILAVRVRSVNVKPYWRSGGRLYQRVQLGATASGNILPIAEVDEKKLGLNTTTLVIFSRIATEYRLSFLPSFWLKDVQLEIWEYTGVDSDLILEEAIAARQLSAQILDKLNEPTP